MNTEERIQSLLDAKPEQLKDIDCILEGRQIPKNSSVDHGPLLITMGKACELLNCSRTTLWRAIQAGSIEKIELFKNSYRLRLDDVLALANRKAV